MTINSRIKDSLQSTSACGQVKEETIKIKLN